MNLDAVTLKELEKEIGLKISDKRIGANWHFGTNLTYFLDGYENIIGLNLRKVNLRAFPSALFGFKKLRMINLMGNNISNLPSEIAQMEELELLDLRGNSIKFLADEVIELNIEIKKFESQIQKSTMLNTGFFLSGNPLEYPPIEIVEKGKKAIKSYFESVEGQKRALNEVKIILIGDGGAGKTSLVKQLVGDIFDENESQTHGINIQNWKVKQQGKEIKVHFWDFGGQEIMHATHQFFLSKRSLYILVLDGRKDEKTEYWLKHIESFGGNSQCLIVLNKIDENPSFDVNRRFLQEKYSGINGFYRISCSEGTGIEYFRKNLGVSLQSIEILETYWAESWFAVKSRLENLKDHYISFEKYLNICVENKVIQKNSQDTLLGFLNDLGIILHFKDFELLDTNVLEPRWVTEAVYKIINSSDLADSKGVLSLSLLSNILEKKKPHDYDFPLEKHRYIIDLMIKFELCYEINNQTVLIPDLLEVQEPLIEFDYSESLKFVVEYDFLPKSIMPRLIVKMNNDIKENLQWRTGLVLEDIDYNSRALIKADEREKKIYINVTGKQKRDYFSVIRYALLSINNGFEKLTAIEKVPMPDQPTVTVSYKHLVRLEGMGVEKYFPDGSEKEYGVKGLLGTIYLEEKSEEDLLKLLNKLRKQSDDEESLIDKANQIIQLQPNFMGIGVNLNKLVSSIFKKTKK